MTAPAGISAQLTFAEEAAYGTYQTPVKAVDLVSEKLKMTRARIESKGLRAGRRMTLSPQWVAGLKTVAGTVNLEVGQVNFGLILKHCMGTIVTSLGRVTGTDGNTTNLQPTITAADGGFNAADVGAPITGTAIPALTTILSVQSATAATMSANATATNANTVFTIGGGAGVNRHLATPGDLTGKGLTMQIGRPDVTGTVRAFSYLGCKINAWTLGCKAGELAHLDLDILAQDETTAQGLAAAVYPANLIPLTFVGGTLKLAGSQVDVKDFTIKGQNKLDPNRAFLRGAATVKEPLENAIRDYMGTFTADFTDLTLYTNYVNGVEAALVLNFAGALISGGQSYGLTLTTNVRFDGDTPDVQGPQTLTQPISFKSIASGATDDTGISISYQTSDTTP